MKAEDLMIGDLIRIGDNVGEICSISAANHKYPDLIEYTLAGKFNELAHTIGLERVLPIPLTCEILEKNGYIHDLLIEKSQIAEGAQRNTCALISDDRRVLASNADCDINSFNNWYVHVDTEDMSTMATMEITYVHELQHALKLCGIEKEIVL